MNEIRKVRAASILAVAFSLTSAGTQSAYALPPEIVTGIAVLDDCTGAGCAGEEIAMGGLDNASHEWHTCTEPENDPPGACPTPALKSATISACPPAVDSTITILANGEHDASSPEDIRLVVQISPVPMGPSEAWIVDPVQSIRVTFPDSGTTDKADSVVAAGAGTCEDNDPDDPDTVSGVIVSVV